MNRKNQEKDLQERDRDETAPQTIIPKFVPNWTQPIRYDRIVINVSGIATFIQIASTKWSPKWQRTLNGK